MKTTISDLPPDSSAGPGQTFEACSCICLERWLRLWQALQAQGDGAGVFQEITGLWSQPQRHYHTLQHLEECLILLDEYRALATAPVLLETVLWFHDAIYDPEHVSDNEGRSADVAREVLGKAAVPEAFIGQVCELIEVTRTHLPDEKKHPDAGLLCDLDLAILGRSEERFLAYERAVREEYRWVPEAAYLAGRSKVLTNFLKRPHLYATLPFQERFEETARRRLQSSLARFSSGFLW